MKLTVHVEGTPAECAVQLRDAANTLQGTKGDAGAGEAPKRGRPAKEEKPAEEEFDLGDGGETEEADEPKHTLDDVIAGFKAFVAKHDREKAAKVLGKYKVKAVRDIPADKYGEVIALLSK